MAWRKPRSPEDVILYPGTQEVEEYVYTPGKHGLQHAEALKEGKILAMRCGDTLIVPPLTFCPDGRPAEGLEEVKTQWRVITYTVIHEDVEGRRLEEPEIIAFLRPDGYQGGLFHRVKASLQEIFIGMPVRPVFRPEEERTGTIADIEYFEPV